MIKVALESFGYKVNTEESGNKAFEKFKTSPNKYDLIITDIVMPLMSGLKLSKKIYDKNPNTPIILITGSSQKISKNILKENHIKEILIKPIEIREIINLVKKVITEKEA